MVEKILGCDVAFRDGPRVGLVVNVKGAENPGLVLGIDPAAGRDRQERRSLKKRMKKNIALATKKLKSGVEAEGGIIHHCVECSHEWVDEVPFPDKCPACGEAFETPEFPQ